MIQSSWVSFFGCFARTIDDPGLPGDFMIYQGYPSISPKRTPMIQLVSSVWAIGTCFCLRNGGRGASRRAFGVAQGADVLTRSRGFWLDGFSYLIYIHIYIYIHTYYNQKATHTTTIGKRKSLFSFSFAVGFVVFRLCVFFPPRFLGHNLGSSSFHFRPNVPHQTCLLPPSQVGGPYADLGTGGGICLGPSKSAGSLQGPCGREGLCLWGGGCFHADLFGNYFVLIGRSWPICSAIR